MYRWPEFDSPTVSGRGVIKLGVGRLQPYALIRPGSGLAHASYNLIGVLGIRQLHPKTRFRYETL